MGLRPSRAGGDCGQTANSNPIPNPQPTPPPKSEAVLVYIPQRLVGRLIGTKGSTVSRIESESGARVRVEADQGASKPDDVVPVRLSGTVQQIAAARAAIEKIAPTQGVRTDLICPRARVGALLGKGGSTVRRIRDESGADVHVDTRAAGAGDATVTIRGTAAQVRAAAERVRKITHPPSHELQCRPSYAPRLIGRSGDTIRALESRFRCRIRVDPLRKRATTRRVFITAHTTAALTAATNAVKSIIEPPFTQQVCPTSAISAFIGDDGETIESLRKRCGSGVSLSVSDGGAGARKGAVVRIEAPDQKQLKEALREVKLAIKAAVEAIDYRGEEGRTLRAQANQHAIERSRLFNLSRDAYAVGDGARAKVLAERARTAGQHMRDANAAAARAIFERRNRNKSALFIDLHGLTVAEALGYLTQRLKAYLANGTDDLLECVTGAGKHSPNHLARVKTAVHELVDGMGLRFEVKNEGTYIIHC